MAIRPVFTGVCTALVTPFTKDGVDENALLRLIEAQLTAGVDALLPCGTTGEPSTLTDDEWARVIALTVRAAAGRAAVIAGTGSNNPRRTVEKARLAQEMGADAQLCVTPYYNKTTQKGLVAYFSAVAEACDLPLIVYNVPARTGLNLLPATWEALSRLPRVAGLKEASGSLTQGARMLEAGPLPVYCGSDECMAPFLRLGAAGVISVLANIAPEGVCALARDARAGRHQTAQARQRALLPLIDALFAEVSPAPVKAALELMGLCNGDVRLPLVRMEAENLRTLKAELIREGLLPA